MTTVMIYTNRSDENKLNMKVQLIAFLAKLTHRKLTNFFGPSSLSQLTKLTLSSTNATIFYLQNRDSRKVKEKKKDPSNSIFFLVNLFSS